MDGLPFQLAGASDITIERSRCESNLRVDAPDPFLDSGSGDFRLAGPTAPGTTLPPPYDEDLSGTTRGADGTWDLGAYGVAE